MTPEELNSLRFRWNWPFGAKGDSAGSDIYALLDEVESLRSQLAEVRKERDDLKEQLSEYAHPLTVRYVPAEVERQLAEARLERDELSKDKHALKMVVSAAIAACGDLTADRDALRAQLDAVPVEAIGAALRTSELGTLGDEKYDAMYTQLVDWLLSNGWSFLR